MLVLHRPLTLTRIYFEKLDNFFKKLDNFFEKIGNFFEKIGKKTLKNSFEVDYQTQKQPRFNPGASLLFFIIV